MPRATDRVGGLSGGYGAALLAALAFATLWPATLTIAIAHPLVTALVTDPFGWLCSAAAAVTARSDADPLVLAARCRCGGPNRLAQRIAARAQG